MGKEIEIYFNAATALINMFDMHVEGYPEGWSQQFICIRDAAYGLKEATSGIEDDKLQFRMIELGTRIFNANKRLGRA